MDSKLQIISGAYRGRKLALPGGARPTQNRARIALFNMLTTVLDMPPRAVWDAFAGSGALGLECLSRYGAARCVFTDVAPATVRKNLATLGVDARATVDAADAMTRVDAYGAASDLIFVDPPYADAALGATFVRRVGAVAAPGTVLVWEQDAAHAVMPGDAWDILRDKTYGRARFLILSRAAV
ncbi:16S rRNA (guanine(966)-N(2))-methyltransferase RsmD [bacterium]|nr:16S rRNA (guanine(966)-N(2))-methyltransferase RsmD [bacterium]